MPQQIDQPDIIAGARAVQEHLRGDVRIRPFSGPVTRVAGIDVAYDRRSGMAFCSIQVLSFPELAVVEACFAHQSVTFPYVPGYLSFREIPVILTAWERVETPVELILCDGQGYAHPRRLGLASHLGVLLGLPTIGCAKSRLIGEHDIPGEARGSSALLYQNGEEVGVVLRTRDRVKPLFVSPGHLMDLPSARDWCLRCCTRYRLPEPTRLADKAVGRYKHAHLEQFPPQEN